MVVNIHEAKTHLSKLLARVSVGEEVVIARGGKPIARLVPLRQRNRKPIFGTAKGQIWMAPDFDEPVEEDRLFDEGPIEPKR